MTGAITAKVTQLRERSPFVDVLWRTKAEAKVDGERRLAAEITYYAFFSLFPLLMVFVTVLDAVLGERRSEEIVDPCSASSP